jgi:uncharacterized protein (TIGR03084 family)
MTTAREIAGDLRAEQEALDAVVAALSPEQWQLQTPSEGWTVADQIGHLTYFDGTAAVAITDAESFRATVDALMAAAAAGDGSFDDLTLLRGRDATAQLEAWRANRRNLAQVATTLTDDMRVVWYGPSMSAKSFLTARLMEVWAHGQDIIDAVGGHREPSDRLRHIAQLGFITRGWTYANRGLTAPEADVRVELQAPSGETWTWGSDGADEVVTGPAVDFCLVVTQRRHVDDTDLKVVGEAARDWLLKAQAFAGPASDGPTPRGA